MIGRIRRALSLQPDRAVAGVVRSVPLDTLVAVRYARDAAGQAAEVSATASEDVSEEGLQGVSVVGGGEHEGGLAVPGEGGGRGPHSGGWSDSGVTRSLCHRARPQRQGLGRRLDAAMADRLWWY